MSLMVSFDSLDENKKKIEIDINDDSVLVETEEEVVPLNVELETQDGLEEVELCEEDIDFNVGFENVEYVGDGDGGESYVYIPHVSQEGIISWTNDGGLPNPSPVNIRGPQGQAGEDGFSPIASVEQTDDGAIVTITDETSTTTAVIKNGVDGKDGSQGPEGPVGPSGKDGVGVPTGGTAGQVLTKQSDVDYDTFWSTPTGGGGGTNDYQDLVNKPSINGVTLQGDVTTEQLGIQDGKDGQNGQDGKDGSNGYTYTPTVSPEGILSWTNDGGLPDPEPVDIRGPRGEQGVQGIQGIQGEAGPQGETGPQGPNGQDGFTPTIALTNVEDGVEIAVTNKDGTTTATVYNGQQGIQGPIGETGATGPEGFSPVVTLTPTDTGLRIDVTNQDSTSSAYLEQGSKDHTVLTNRNANDQHSISAITGLQSALDGKQPTGNYALASNVPTSTSQLTNDSGFITNVVSDLVNYYTKSQTYSAEEIDQRISAIPKFAIEVVNTLPTEDISSTTVYLLRTGDTDNLYTEYIYVSGAWEVLGQQKVDLTGYATETWVEGKLADYIGVNALQDAIDTALAQAKASGAFDGKDGTNGVDGVGIESITYKETDAQGGNVYDVNLSNGTSYDITAPRGLQGIKGENGETPVKGVDYWTEADIQSMVTQAVNGVLAQKATLLEVAYPVGAIYMSTASTSPETLFGFGTWERVQDCFLLAAGSTYVAGETGGAATHNHTYGLKVYEYYNMAAFNPKGGLTGAINIDNGTLGTWTGGSSMAGVETLNSSLGTSTTSANPYHYESRANTSTKSNMPPYLAVYVWKRTA